MNLQDIRNEIAFQLQHDPDNNDYRDRVSREVNNAYNDILDMGWWSFLEVDEDYSVYPSTVIDSTDISGTSGTVISGLSGLFAAWMEGHSFSLVDTGGSPITGRIVEVVDDDTMHVDVDATLTGAAGDLTITVDRHKLPNRCSLLLSFVDRADERGKLVFLDRSSEEALLLDRDDTSDDPSFVIPDDEVEVLNPPHRSPSLASSSGLGSLTPGDTYRVFYAFYGYGGLVSGRSGVASVTVAAGDNEITVTGFDEQGNDAAKLGYYIYVEVNRSGYFYLHDFLTYDDMANTYSFSYDITANKLATLDQSLSVWSDEVRGRYVRFHPRPADDATGSPTANVLRVRYLRTTPRLVRDTDVPLLPARFHDALVHGAIMRLAPRADDSGTYKTSASLYRDRISLLKKSHLRSVPRSWRKGFSNSSLAVPRDLTVSFTSRVP